MWAVGRNRSTLAATARQCNRGSVHVRPADLTRGEETKALAEELEREAGRVDVLVHCAGTIAHGNLADASVQSLDAQYDANVRAFYVLVQGLLPMLIRGPGHVVVVNSSVVSRPRAGAGLFAATQNALRALTDTLREEVNEHGVRVLSVFPGRTATSRQERLYAEEGRPYTPEVLLQPSDLATMIVAAVSLPRTAEVTDLHIRPALKTY